MAHYKRRKCRSNCLKAIRGSQTSWRARFGFKPIRILWEDIPHWSVRHGSAEWDAMWHPRGRHGNRGRKIGGPYSMMNSYPAWWDRTFHTRPRRAKERVITRRILQGTLDPEDTAWPLSKKPHSYYW
jgi:hypothetical protein